MAHAHDDHFIIFDLIEHEIGIRRGGNAPYIRSAKLEPA
jgi:hypothetical protein